MELDRQAIERRDFPIARRGYDTAAVDAHLRALAEDFEALERSARGPDTSLAAAASSQVQSIIQAAESAAAEIERDAAEEARRTREEAARDAQRTREQAIAKARAHASAVAEAATRLLERVSAMDAQATQLTERLRAGAGTLEGELAALHAGMAELYDAASPSGSRAEQPAPAAASAAQAAPAAAAPPLPSPAAVAPAAGDSAPAPAASAPAAAASAQAGDLDGARLVALNMALSGEPREQTARYLADNFELPDRDALVDEVYAAIEG